MNAHTRQTLTFVDIFQKSPWLSELSPPPHSHALPILYANIALERIAESRIPIVWYGEKFFSLLSACRRTERAQAHPSVARCERKVFILKAKHFKCLIQFANWIKYVYGNYENFLTSFSKFFVLPLRYAALLSVGKQFGKCSFFSCPVYYLTTVLGIRFRRERVRWRRRQQFDKILWMFINSNAVDMQMKW